MFNSQDHKSGKWLKFELTEKPQLVCVHQGQVRRGTLVEGEDLDVLLRKAQRSADGRLVGVFVKGGVLRTPGDGKNAEQFHRIPDSIAPIRKILGVDGSHNLSFAFDGAAHTLLIALDSCQNVDLILVREDIPAYRNATLHENFDPQQTARTIRS